MSKSISPLTQVAGFRAVGVTCGLKSSGNPDLALILSKEPCAAAAVFTTNTFKAAPVLYDLAALEQSKGWSHGVVINAGNANAITGQQGLRDAEQMARWVEQACGLPAGSILVMSTGVIGQKMPMTQIKQGIRLASEAILTEAGERGEQVIQAMMTTDLVPKEAFVQTTLGDQLISIGGVAKGSGMIHPGLATMLVVITTDVMINPKILYDALFQAVYRTFNRITVDGDMSTNDTVLILASGAVDEYLIDSPSSPEFEKFVAALTELCAKLAKAIVRDGEGATKLIEITVQGAWSQMEAEKAAKAVATSPLVKTALFGNDPNWGRVLAAIGRSGAKVDPARVSLRLGDFQLVEQGEPLAVDIMAVHDWLVGVDEVSLVADLGTGQEEATVWTCDLSYKYVEINAEYHT